MIWNAEALVNYASDKDKEIAMLQHELRNATDALDVLKKQSAFSGKITEAIYVEVADKTEKIRKSIAASLFLEC